MNELRLAVRQMLKHPGFTAVTMLTLALCMGANSAIFSVVRAVLLRPLPYPEADRLVFVHNSYPKSNLLKAGCSIPDYLDRVGQASSIESAALFTWESFNLGGSDQPRRVLGLVVTPSFFATLRVTPKLGQAFGEAEARPGNERVVLLSYSLWQEQYGGRDDVLGQSVRLHGISYTVVGVMPPAFQFPQPEVKLWVPFAFTPEQRSDSERGHEYSSMLVRLKPDATARQLEAECSTLIQRNLERFPDQRGWVASTGFSALVVPALEEAVGDRAATLWLIQAGVIAALIIGCVNVGNLLLSRASMRRQELAVRAALGASRWQIMRQLGTECLLIFAGGGLLGWLAAQGALSVADSLGIASLPRGDTASLDWGVFLFTLICVGFVTLVFGLMPSWFGASVDASETLRDGTARSSGGRSHQRIRHALVVSQVALAVMLVTTAGLFYRSFAKLQQQNPGFDRTSTLTARLTLPPSKYPTDDQRRDFAEQAVAALRSLPAVTTVGFSDAVPFGYQNSQGTYYIDGLETSADQPPPHGLVRSVSEDYFQAMRIPLLQGRMFNSGDTANAEQVVIIDRVLADRYFAGRDAVGQRLYRNPGESKDFRTIVGVVAAVKHQGLDDPTRKETIYFPYTQRPVESFTLVLRASSDPKQLIPAVRRAIQRLDPDQPIYDIATLASRINATLQPRRLPVTLLGAFGVLSLFLAALGIYGVLSFHVGQRRREFGIRSSLGATARDVTLLVIGHGLRLVGLGVAGGLLGYMMVSGAVRSLVYEVTPLDPLAVAGGCATLVGVALLACWIPARRAAGVDPLVALRQ
jgi:putative ABC transport system permease protein